MSLPNPGQPGSALGGAITPDPALQQVLTGQPPQPAAPPAESTPDMAGWSESQIAAWKHVNGEDKRHRLQAQAEKARAEVAEAELKKYRDQEAEAARKKLEAEGEYKTLIEQERQRATQEVLKAKEFSLQTAMKAALIQAGAKPEFAALLDKNGITIDEAHNVSGVDIAIEKMKMAHPELFRAATPPSDPNSGGQAPPNPTQPRTGLNTMPGTMMTYEEHAASLANAGRQPTPAPNTSPNKPKLDFSKKSMKTSQEVNAAYEALKRALPKG